jgi:nicotinamidase-related amidase
MALTIDKKTAALLIMDCENDIVHVDGKGAKFTGLGEIIQKKGVLKNIRKVLDAARQAKIPVIYMTVDNDRIPPGEWPRRGQFFEKIGKMAGQVLQKGTWGAEIHEEVKPEPGELILGKSIISAFARSDLEGELKKRGVKDVILTGGGTHMVVESTARNAVDRGFSVITVEDGVAGSIEHAHHASLHMLQALGDVAPADEVANALRS